MMVTTTQQAEDNQQTYTDGFLFPDAADASRAEGILCRVHSLYDVTFLIGNTRSEGG